MLLCISEGLCSTCATLRGGSLPFQCSVTRRMCLGFVRFCSVQLRLEITGDSSGAERHGEWLDFEMSGDVCDPLTQWFRNISSTLSLLRSQILPFSLNSTQSHPIAERAGGRGQILVYKLSVFHFYKKEQPSYEWNDFVSFAHWLLTPRVFSFQSFV